MYELRFLESTENILSSLSRYHPDKWSKLISTQAGEYAAIVEEFMNLCLSTIPTMTLKIMHGDFMR